MEELYRLSENLKQLRKEFGYTQTYVAEKLGIRYQSYHAYETGIAVPTLKHFIELAKLYEISLDELIQ